MTLSALPDLLAAAIAATSVSAGQPGPVLMSASMDTADRAAALSALAAEDPSAVVSAAASAGGGVLVTLGELVLFARVFLVALLNERNDILADNIRAAAARAKGGKAVVAVLGMAHVNGVAALLDLPDSRPRADEV